MKPSLHPANEKARLKALKALNILDTPAEQGFDDIVRLACMVCGTPFSLFSLVDEKRLWFKASHGFSGTQISRDTSFCNYTIQQKNIMLVPDALQDERFISNPLVTGDSTIRFYAGIAVLSASGLPLGTLCVLDHTPRTLSGEQIFALDALARQVQHLLMLKATTDAVEKTKSLLQLRQEKYRNITTNLNLGLLEVDNEEKILFANEAFCNMSGYDFEELKDRKPSDLFTAGENSAVMNAKNLVRKDGTADVYEIAVKNKRGQVKWWLISGAPRFDETGNITGSIGIHMDVTSQKAMEADLANAKRRAHDSTRTKEIFLANISHEIRTPLNAISGMAGQLAKTALDKQQQFYLTTIHAATENLLLIINDILDLSKIEAGKLQLERIGFDIREMLNRVVRVFGHKAEEKGLTFTTATVDTGIAPILIGDPFRLNQVLLNLINNAIKFTEKGSVDISCALLKDSGETQLLRIDVKDTGIGMTEDFVSNLFEKFSQEDASVTRQYGGTGLGMIICKDLVELMDGTITVESKKGVSTTVSFTIAFEKGIQDTLPAKQLPQEDNAMLLGKKILLVDDSSMNRLVAATILKNYGAMVNEAANGLEAIDYLKQTTADLVLMDIQMPVMDGMEAAGIIRQNISKTIPIVALTANAIKGYNDKCIEAGMNGYLSKPFKERDLADTVAFWLNKTRLSINHASPEMNVAALYDLSNMRALSRGNQQFVEKMIHMFIAQAPVQAVQLQDYFLQQQYKAMGNVAHSLKPVIDNMGIQSLKNTIREIEKQGKQEVVDAGTAVLVSDVKNIIELVVTDLKIKFPETT